MADFQRQWTVNTSTGWDSGMLICMEYYLYCSYICCGLFLEDGRFAFLMQRYWGDLRTSIDLHLKNKNFEGSSFSDLVAMRIMEDIAHGMYRLHVKGALHRDLKAANVLIIMHERIVEQGDTLFGYYRACVADYESSLLVQGTRFWRATEVLKALQKPGQRDQNAMIWTEKVDVYSYAMTCYEILTGLIPFLGYYKSNWDMIIVHGERPHVPHYVNPKLKDLMERCWHGDPSKRPDFGAILFELNSFLPEGYHPRSKPEIEVMV